MAARAHAATLAPETIAAWETYIATVNEAFERRLDAGGNFQWTFEDSARTATVRNGTIVAAPASGRTPERIPGGLIHHWMGAVFLPGANIDDVLAITQDYDRYQEFFRPSVLRSRLVARNGCQDIFSVLVLNKAFFMRSALEADYESVNIRLEQRRFYSTTKSTRVQEIEKYGQPGEHLRPEGAGDGYLWKLYTISRLEQHDDGVFYEIEVLELSRDIPPAFRFIVEPIVRHLSRSALLLSLRQTRDAVLSRLEQKARSARGARSRIPREVGVKDRDLHWYLHLCAFA